MGFCWDYLQYYLLIKLFIAMKGPKRTPESARAGAEGNVIEDNQPEQSSRYAAAAGLR